jgi:hypothetical protein
VEFSVLGNMVWFISPIYTLVLEAMTPIIQVETSRYLAIRKPEQTAVMELTVLPM